MTTVNFTVLRNNGTTITLDNGTRIFIGGVDDLQLGTPNLKKVLKYKDKKVNYIYYCLIILILYKT